jgi:hypothetical protein
MFLYIEPFDFPVLWLFTLSRKSGISRLENYEIHWPCTVLSNPVAPQCQCFSDTCSSTAFQNGGKTKQAFLLSTKKSRQLKILVLSFLTLSNFNTFYYLNTWVVYLLFIKCLHVKLTFCYWAGLSHIIWWFTPVWGAVVVFCWL